MQAWECTGLYNDNCPWILVSAMLYAKSSACVRSFHRLAFARGHRACSSLKAACSTLTWRAWETSSAFCSHSSCSVSGMCRLVKSSGHLCPQYCMSHRFKDILTMSGGVPTIFVKSWNACTACVSIRSERRCALGNDLSQAHVLISACAQSHAPVALSLAVAALCALFHTGPAHHAKAPSLGSTLGQSMPRNSSDGLTNSAQRLQIPAAAGAQRDVFTNSTCSNAADCKTACSASATQPSADSKHALLWLVLAKMHWS